MRSRNAVLSAIDDADFAALQPDMRRIALAAGQDLADGASASETLYFPTGAVIARLVTMEDGREVQAAGIGREGVAGLLAGLSGSPDALRTVVQVGGEAITLPASVLRGRIAASPGLAAVVLRHAHASAVQTELSVACQALHSVAARLARWLLISRDRADGPVLRLTQEDLSIMAGTLRTSVSTTASALRDAGLISYSRGKLEILDGAELERRACPCYRMERKLRDSIAKTPSRPIG